MTHLLRNGARALLAAGLLSIALLCGALSPASAATRHAEIVGGLVHHLMGADEYALYQRPAPAPDGSPGQTVAQAAGMTIVTVTDDAVQEGWVYSNGAFAAPPPPPAPVLQPVSLQPVDFLKHLMAHGGVTLAQIAAARDDANLKGAWVFFDAVREGIHRDDAMTQTFLALMQSLGYFDAAHKQAVLDAWPVQ
jgi:hypothetical protein